MGRLSIRATAMNTYTLQLENDQLHNITPFIKFCRDHEHTDIKLIVNQESHCLQFCGVYAILDLFTFTSVTIVTANAVECHDRYRIVINWAYWLKQSRKFKTSNDYTWNQTKIFGCFYGRPSAPRVGIAGHLAQHYNDKSLLQLRFNTDSEDTRKLVDIQKLFAWDTTGAAKLDQLVQNKEQYFQPIPAYEYTTGSYDYNSDLNNLYKNIFVDIVVEATTLGNTFYPTEKIARAILCRKPFIVMASKFYLGYLKQIGFKTFDEYWPELYDNADGKARYLAILELIDRLAKLSTAELAELNIKMQHTIEYNRQLLIAQQYNKQVTRIIPHYEN
jgi:hypothetical protein